MWEDRLLVARQKVRGSGAMESERDRDATALLHHLGTRVLGHRDMSAQPGAPTREALRPALPSALTCHPHRCSAQFSSHSLMAISDDHWLQQLLGLILERIDQPCEEKAFLYRLYGFTLRTSRNARLVQGMLAAMLHTCHEEHQQMEGISATLSIVSIRHLQTTLDQLRVYSTLLTDADSAILSMAQEQQRREWGLVCHTIYLSYGKILLESQGAAYSHLDAILRLVLYHYYSCVVEKDKSLKLEYLNALTRLTTILSSQPMAFQFEFPHKLDIVVFMVGLIREEPLNAISSPIRQKAMHILTDFRKLRPLLELEEKTELLRTCIKSVLSLPPTDSMLKEGASAKENQANVDLFRETLQTLRRLMEALVAEMPSRIQHYLELLDPWLNSQKDNERERAMWCTARILGFMAKMNTFQASQSSLTKTYLPALH